jgi:SAM-dependent methyltransferase
MRSEIFLSKNGNEIVIVDFETLTAQVLPRHCRWDAVAALPLDISVKLNEWSNALEYSDSSYLRDENLTETLPNWVGGMVAGMGIDREERILDFGTGTGAMRLALLRDGYLETVGVDVSADCLERQSELAVQLGLSAHDDGKRNLLTLSEIRSDLKSFEGTFSLIILSSSLHHLADLRGFFQLCYSLLRPGGKIVALNEPINKKKWHTLNDTPNIEIDIIEVFRMMNEKIMQKTASSTMLAEFWDGAGFDRNYISELLEDVGLKLVGWQPQMWLSYIFHIAVRNDIIRKDDHATLCAFEEIYAEILKIENRVRQLVSDKFKEDNFFTVTMTVERPKDVESI